MSAISLHFRGKAREKEDHEESSLEDTALRSLAKNKFRLVSPPQYNKKEPRQPLLRATPDEEKQNIIRIWRVMMRFNGDMSDHCNVTDTSTQPYLGSVIERLSKRWGLAADDSPDDTAPTGSHNSAEGGLSLRSLPNKPRGGTLRHLRSALTQRIFKTKNEAIYESILVEDTLITPLDHVHYVASCGILKPRLRDEIYCMICKQLVKNPSKTSISQYWLLLALISGCFPPSKEIFDAIQQFIEEGPPAYCKMITKLLKRSAINGPRYQPPSHREIECYKQRKAIELHVTLMDGTVQTVVVDGTSTAHDVTEQLNESLGLRKHFGYSIFISMSNKVASLGSGDDHVMDAISQCEQLYREQGGTESDAPWRLFYRKELFSPWEDLAGDMIAISLTYSQITRGIMLGEYICHSDQDLAVLAARQYFIEYGSEISEEGLEGVLPSYIPADRRQQPQAMKMWRRLVTKAHHRLFSSRKRKEPTIDEVKLDVLQYAKNNWAMAFSRYYEVFKVEGPHWGDNQVKLAINASGVYVMTPSKRQLYAMSYPDIITIRGESNKTTDTVQTDDIVLFVLADGSFIKFETLDAIDIRHLVTDIIQGMCTRSKWAVVKEDIDDSSSENIHMSEGDLIELLEPAGADIFNNETRMCTNARTGETGVVATRIMYIIPTLQRPADHILKMFQTIRRRVPENANEYLEGNDEQDNPTMVNNRQHSVVNMQHSDVNMQHSVVNMQHSDVSMQHSGDNMQHSDVNVEHSDITRTAADEEHGHHHSGDKPLSSAPHPDEANRSETDSLQREEEFDDDMKADICDWSSGADFKYVPVCPPEDLNNSPRSSLCGLAPCVGGQVNSTNYLSSL